MNKQEKDQEKGKTIALIAHDGGKTEMVNFAQNNLAQSNEKFNIIIATGTTGKHLHDAVLTQSLLSGPMGGDAQIGSLVSKGKIDAVFFFAILWEKIPTRT